MIRFLTRLRQALGKQPLEPTILHRVSSIISSRIGDDNNVIVTQNFKDIDLFEPVNGIPTYNREKLVAYIKAALSKIKKEQAVFAYGCCNTKDILFIVRKTALKKDNRCPRCGLHITRFNSCYIGISETTGEEFECGSCGFSYDTGPSLSYWKALSD